MKRPTGNQRQREVDPDDVWHTEVRAIDAFRVVVYVRNGHGETKVFTSPEPTDDIGRQFEAEYDKMRSKWIDMRNELQRKADRLIADLRAKAATEGRKLTFKEISRAAGFESIGKLGPRKEPDRRFANVLDEMDDAA